jgi:hypothetical protein
MGKVTIRGTKYEQIMNETRTKENKEGTKREQIMNRRNIKGTNHEQNIQLLRLIIEHNAIGCKT